MSTHPRRKTLGQRIKDHLFFSVVSMTVIFVGLSLVGIKAKFGSLVLSILLTLALNVGLTYYYEHKTRKAERDWEAGRVPHRPRDTDIRFRD